MASGHFNLVCQRQTLTAALQLQSKLICPAHTPEAQPCLLPVGEWTRCWFLISRCVVWKSTPSNNSGQNGAPVAHLSPFWWKSKNAARRKTQLMKPKRLAAPSNRPPTPFQLAGHSNRFASVKKLTAESDAGTGHVISFQLCKSLDFDVFARPMKVNRKTMRSASAPFLWYQWKKESRKKKHRKLLKIKSHTRKVFSYDLHNVNAD